VSSKGKKSVIDSFDNLIPDERFRVRISFVILPVYKVDENCGHDDKIVSRVDKEYENRIKSIGKVVQKTARFLLWIIW